MSSYDRFARRQAYAPVPTGWRRNSLIGITATVLMTAGLLVAAATMDDAHAATVVQLQVP
jgi:hypothetical protein